MRMIGENIAIKDKISLLQKNVASETECYILCTCHQNCIYIQLIEQGQTKWMCKLFDFAYDISTY